MALRINTNLEAIRSLRNLRASERAQQSSLERLATGLRINRASDDPAGLVISEQLRAQIQGLKQASENTQNATNLIGTADSALQQVHDLLNQIRGSVLVALNGGSPAQIAAEQASIDEAVSAIDRIAQTTRFGDRSLLNGTSGYNLSAKDGDLTNFDLRRFVFASGATDRTVDVDYTDLAERAEITGVGVATGDSVIRITGALGSREVTVADTEDASLAINAVALSTGVFADGAGSVFSEKFGDSQNISLELISGTVAGVAGIVTAQGVDGIASVNGAVFTGDGLHFSVHLPDAEFDFDFTDTTAAGTFSFTAVNSGIGFQVNETANPVDRISLGLRDISASTLGINAISDELGLAATGVTPPLTKGGFLSSLVTGGTNSLANNPTNSLSVIDGAQADISSLRGFLGAIQKFNLEPNLNNLEVSIENISAAESSIRDLDFAEESAQLAKVQVLFQAGIAVLGSANLIPQTVLTLLQ